MTCMSVQWLRSDSFAKLKVLKKKKKCLITYQVQHAIPRSTRSGTKWAIKIFQEWQATRRNKNCLEEQVGFKLDIRYKSIYVRENFTRSVFNSWRSIFLGSKLFNWEVILQLKVIEITKWIWLVWVIDAMINRVFLLILLVFFL